jgi:hypothetical protein
VTPSLPSPPARRGRAVLASGALVAALAALAGCGVQRVLLVDSTPPGAHLTVNGVDRGKTPVRIPYVHDGLFTVRLELEGYESIADEIWTETRTDARPGIDFFAENTGPRRERVTTKHFDFAPLKRSSYTDAEIDAMFGHAKDFRRRTEREVGEPGTPVPTRPAPPPAAGTKAAPPSAAPTPSR